MYVLKTIPNSNFILIRNLKGNNHFEFKNGIKGGNKATSTFRGLKNNFIVSFKTFNKLSIQLASLSANPITRRQ